MEFGNLGRDAAELVYTIVLALREREERGDEISQDLIGQVAALCG